MKSCNMVAQRGLKWNYLVSVYHVLTTVIFRPCRKPYRHSTNGESDNKQTEDHKLFGTVSYVKEVQ